MNTQISLATLNDLDKVWALRLKSTSFLKSQEIDQWQYEEPSKKDFEADINSNMFYILKNDNQIIGMYKIMFEIEKTYLEISGLWNEDKPYATIHRFAIDSDYHNKGYGKLLLKHAENIAISNGFKYMRIDTHEKNIKAQTLFKGFGYVYCGLICLDIKQGEKKRLAFDKKLEDIS